MLRIHGSYTEVDVDFDYQCRVFWDGKRWHNGIDETVDVKHGDILYVAGNGSWFAWYTERPKGHVPTAKEESQ